MESLDRLFNLIESPTAIGSQLGLEQILLSLLMAFVLGQLTAWVYWWTHSGLSYSRSFAQALILLTLGVSLVMLVIGNSLVTAFGLLGALALVRFRNVLKDTRDTAYIFSCLVLGMAVGSQRFGLAIIGAVAILGVALYLDLTAFGSRGRFDGYLRCRMPIDPGEGREFFRVMQRFCLRINRVSFRQMSESPQAYCAFQVRLRDKDRSNDLVTALQGVEGVQNVSLVVQDEMSEA